MLQPLVVCRVIWLPLVAWLTASITSISPLLGQLAGLLCGKVRLAKRDIRRAEEAYSVSQSAGQVAQP
jgi:hypothetical protein